MKTVACHISKRRMPPPSSHYSVPHSEPWGDSEWRQMGCLLPSPQPGHLLQLVHPGGFRKRKNKILAPDRWGADQRNDFKEPRLLHLPRHRKVLNSSTWDFWFSLILMFWCSSYLVFVTKPPTYSGSFLTSLEQSLRAILRRCLWGL